MAETRTEIKLSKMQKIRKRELRRALTRLHERLKLVEGWTEKPEEYGLRVAITIIGDMRKEINLEVSRG